MELSTTILNNREISALICFVLFFGYAFRKTDVRASFVRFLKILVSRRIAIFLSLFLSYIASMVLLLSETGFWDFGALKGTIYWFFGFAFITFVDLNKINNDDNYFDKIILDNIKLIFVFEFLANLYSFDLIYEIIIVPTVTLLVMIEAYSGYHSEYKSVETLLDYLLAGFGLILIALTIFELTGDIEQVGTVTNFRNFLLPIVLSLMLLPFIYCVALYMKYESIFSRLKWFNKESKLVPYARMEILLYCRVNLKKLIKLSKTMGILKLETKNDVVDYWVDLKRYNKPSQHIRSVIEFP